MSSSPVRTWIARVLITLVIATITLVFVLMFIQFVWGGDVGHQLTTLVPRGSFAQSIHILHLAKSTVQDFISRNMGMPSSMSMRTPRAGPRVLSRTSRPRPP